MELEVRERILEDRNRKLEYLKRKIEDLKRFERSSRNNDESPNSKADGRLKTVSGRAKFFDKILTSFDEIIGSSWMFGPFQTFEHPDHNNDKSPNSKADGGQKTQSESPESSENQIAEPDIDEIPNSPANGRQDPEIDRPESSENQIAEPDIDEKLTRTFLSTVQGRWLLFLMTFASALMPVLKIRSIIDRFLAASKQFYQTRTRSNNVRGQALLILLTFALTRIPAYAEIIVSPKDVEAVQGTSVVFNCSSSIPETDVQWNHYPIGKSMQVIYAYGKISSQHVDRFTIRDGHNLHISSVTPLDAGTYECQDDIGFGERRSAELIVIVTNPICQSSSNLNKILGNNIWGIEPSQVILSCSVQYLGNKAPTLEWKNNGEEKTITTGVSSEIQGNRFVHTLSLKGDSIADGTSYNCCLAKAASLATCNSGRIAIIDESAVNSHRELPHTYVPVIICICVIICLGSFSFVLIIIVWKNKKQTGKRMRQLFRAIRKVEEMGTHNEELQAQMRDPESQ